MVDSGPSALALSVPILGFRRKWSGLTNRLCVWTGHQRATPGHKRDRLEGDIFLNDFFKNLFSENSYSYRIYFDHTLPQLPPSTSPMCLPPHLPSNFIPHLLLFLLPLITQVQGCGAIHRVMGNPPGLTSPKESDSPSLSDHQPPIVLDLGGLLHPWSQHLGEIDSMA